MAVTTEELLAAAARAAATDDFDTLYTIDAELIERERAAAAGGEAPVITDHAAGQLPAAEAPEYAGGPFVIVTGSGDRVPDSPAYEDWATAVRARDRANRRASLLGRPAAYQIAPADTGAGSPCPEVREARTHTARHGGAR